MQFTYGSEVYIWIKSLHAGLKLTNGSEVYIWIRSLDTGQTFTYGSNVYICRKFTYRSEVYIQVKSIYMGQKLTFFLRSLHTGQRFMYGSEVYIPFESLHKFTQTHTQLHFQNDSLFRLSLKLALFILEKQVFFFIAAEIQLYISTSHNTLSWFKSVCNIELLIYWLDMGL